MVDNSFNDSEPFQAEPSEFLNFLFDWAETIAQALIIIIFVLTFVFRVFTVKGNSMFPNLHNDDKVFVWKYNYVPTKGDVVVVKKFGNVDESIVKRVIATEGDTFYIDFDRGAVYVNGKLLNETYINHEEENPMIRKAEDSLEPPSVIPKGTCFVMGDNRNHSSDSRSVYIGGVIDYKDIVGVVKYKYFPFYRIGNVPREVG